MVATDAKEVIQESQLAIRTSTVAGRFFPGDKAELSLALSAYADKIMPLRTVMASFVTLEIGGRLLGCMGSMVAHRPLVADVIANAVKAGFEDRRFGPLSAEELEQADIKVLLLTRSQNIEPESEAARPDTAGQHM